MNYKIIFTTGYIDDEEGLMKGYKSDVLLLDEANNYYVINFIELEVIKNTFSENKICFLESNMVILHSITKENILKSVHELHQWNFFLHWLPLSIQLVEKYYYPKESWMIFEVVV